MQTLPDDLEYELEELLKADTIDHDRIEFEHDLNELVTRAYNLGFEDGFNEYSET